MSKSYDAIGALLVVLLISNIRGFEYGGYGTGVASARKPGQTGLPPVSPPRLGNILSDFHRMTDAMGRVDALGQMVAKPETAKPAIKQMLGELSDPAAPGSGFSLPDLSGLAGALAPLLSTITGG